MNNASYLLPIHSRMQVQTLVFIVVAALWLQSEVSSLRSNELLDLQARMGAAIQRIAELEAALQRCGNPGGSRPAGNDDTRAIIRDNKFRRTPRISPHNSARSPGSEHLLYCNNAPADNVKLRTRQVGKVLLLHRNNTTSDLLPAWFPAYSQVARYAAAVGSTVLHTQVLGCTSRLFIECSFVSIPNRCWTILKSF